MTVLRPCTGRRAGKEKGLPKKAFFNLSRAGQAAGGDTRGMQSAAMLIVKKNAGVWLNNDTVLRLQVDHSPDTALKELRRIVEYWNSRRR